LQEADVVKILKGASIFTLPDYMAVDNFNVTVDNPSISRGGRDGELVTGPSRIKGVTFVVSGIVKGKTKAELTSICDFIKQAVLGGPIRLYPDHEDTRSIVCTCEKVDHNYHRGQFGGSVSAITANFKSAESAWEDVPIISTTALTGIEKSLTLFNDGSLPGYIDVEIQFSQPAILSGKIFAGAVDATITDEFSVDTGSKLVYSGRDLTVTVDGMNMLGAFGDDLFLGDGMIAPGEPVLTVMAGIVGTLIVTLKPRFA
jgi:hypothetical protein